jgi:membrane-bound lytic murein transglycosylase D
MNLPPENNPVHSAGMWQMIPQTARSAGLAVDGLHDERMDPALESQAAARLLSGLYGELGDWRLVVLAYNAGGEFVERSIRRAGTRDAFQLTERGYENDRHYLARVMAAIIIVKNADTLDLT